MLLSKLKLMQQTQKVKTLSPGNNRENKEDKN